MYLLLIMYYVVVKDQRREIPLSRLLKFSCQIAEGMGYLVCSRATIYVYVVFVYLSLVYVCACVFVCVCVCLSLVCVCLCVRVFVVYVCINVLQYPL